VKLFLSYRRDDARHIADRVYQSLGAEYGSDSIFKDVIGMKAAANRVSTRIPGTTTSSVAVF
jgi:hypothetical protein